MYQWVTLARGKKGLEHMQKMEGINSANARHSIGTYGVPYDYNLHCPQQVF